MKKNGSIVASLSLSLSFPENEEDEDSFVAEVVKIADGGVNLASGE